MQIWLTKGNYYWTYQKYSTYLALSLQEIPFYGRLLFQVKLGEDNHPRSACVNIYECIYKSFQQLNSEVFFLLTGHLSPESTRNLKTCYYIISYHANVSFRKDYILKYQNSSGLQLRNQCQEIFSFMNIFFKYWMWSDYFLHILNGQLESLTFQKYQNIFAKT